MRALAEALHQPVAALSPSIIKYASPTPYDTDRVEALSALALESLPPRAAGVPAELVRLVSHTDSPDLNLCAALLFRYGGGAYEAAHAIAHTMDPGDRRRLVRTALSQRSCWDRADRTFETIEFLYELTVSATNYAQLKRHRMTTQIVQGYDLTLGVTVPPNIVEIGMEKEFHEAVRRSEECYARLAEQCPDEKDYILTNAHRRRVLTRLNARELYHFAALREDEHAQWDIRDTARKMRETAEAVAPLTMMMLCGKSDFDARRTEIYGTE
jgi:hypothetical protein